MKTYPVVTPVPNEPVAMKGSILCFGNGDMRKGDNLWGMKYVLTEPLPDAVVQHEFRIAVALMRNEAKNLFIEITIEGPDGMTMTKTISAQMGHKVTKLIGNAMLAEMCDRAGITVAPEQQPFDITTVATLSAEDFPSVKDER